MCISPSFIWVQRGPKWEKQPVACRQCWSCRRNRVNDYVARSLCEASVSEHVCALTLTYAPRTDLADKLLQPAHFQLFMKRLRRSGHKVRYLVAGEYGETRGRAHFHALLFFKDLKDALRAPFYNPDHIQNPQGSAAFSGKIPNKRMVHIREWPHGHILCDWSASERSAKYVCKYLLKAEDEQRWFSLSKKPPLGAEWFAKRAEEAKGMGVLPYSFNYVPPGGSKRGTYLMTGATRRDYLAALAGDAADMDRMSEMVAKTYEKHMRLRRIAELERLPPDEQFKAWLDRVSDAQEVRRIADHGAACRYVDYLAELIHTHGGPLVWRSGRWVPQSEVHNVETFKRPPPGTPGPAKPSDSFGPLPDYLTSRNKPGGS